MSKISLHDPVHQSEINSLVSLMAELTSSFSTEVLDFCSQAPESESTGKSGSSDPDSDIDWDNYDEGAEEDWADIDGPDSSAGQSSQNKCQPLFLSLVNSSRQGGPNAK